MVQQDGASTTDNVNSSTTGGWKWMIVLAHGVCQSFVLALVQNFALLCGGLFSRLDMTATDVGIVLNCNAAFGSIFAVVAGSLLRRFGQRKMAVLGGLLLALGVGCSGLAASFSQLLFYYGFLSSLGAGLMLSSTSVALNTYHSEDGGGRLKALVAAAVAAGAVPVAAPLAVAGLLGRYGLPGAALLCAALCLHCVAAVALLRPTSESFASKEDKNNKTEPTIRRGTIVPVMKIDAPEDEVKPTGSRRSSRRSSGMSSGPQRRGTPGWSERQSMGSIYAGMSSRIYDARSYQMTPGEDEGLLGYDRSSRSSSIAMEPMRMAGQEASMETHSKKLDVPNSGQRAGERRLSTLSAGSGRWSQRLSIGSVHSTGSALAVVVDEDEPDGPPSDKVQKQRRPTGASVASIALEVPGEQTPGSRMSSGASTRSGRDHRGSWWGRLSVGSASSAGGHNSRTLAVGSVDDDNPASGASSQSELSQRDGSTNSSIQISSGDSLRARRQSEGSRIGTSARGDSSGKLELPSHYERTRQMSVSSERSAASSWQGYMTAAQSLRSTGSQGSGQWWSTLSLASAHSIIQEVEEMRRHPAEVTRLLDGEDPSTPETPPEQRRGSWDPFLPTAPSGMAEKTLVTPGDIHGLVGVSNSLPIGQQPQSLIETLGDTVNLLGDSSKDDKFRSVGPTPISSEDTNSLVEGIGKDSHLLPLDRLPTFPENPLIKKMLASPEDTSDLGSSDGEYSENDPEKREMPAHMSKVGTGGDITPSGFIISPATLGNPAVVSAVPPEIKESRVDCLVDMEYSPYTKDEDIRSSRKTDSYEMETAGDATSASKTESKSKENNVTVDNIQEETGRIDKWLDGRREVENVSSDYAPMEKIITANDEFNNNVDDNIMTVVESTTEPDNTGKPEVLGNSIDKYLNTGVAEVMEEQLRLLDENKTTETKHSAERKPTGNSTGKPPERYSIIVSVPEGGAGRRAGSPSTYELDTSSLKSVPRSCLLLGLALAYCADVNHAAFTPLLLGGRHVVVSLCAVAAADLAARILVPVVLAGCRPRLKATCLAGFLLLVVSRTLLTMLTGFSSVVLACVFLGASRGVSSVYFAAVYPGDDGWSSLCLQMVSRGLVFLALGPLVGSMKDWSGDFGASVLAINVATVVAVLLCCVENFYPAK